MVTTGVAVKAVKATLPLSRIEVGSAIGCAVETRKLASDSEPDRPRLRRVRITRRPVCERIRTRKPETRLRFLLVPPRVRLVIAASWRPADQN